MPDVTHPVKDPTLRSKMREAREAYFEVSAELDELNLEVRTQTHGMVQPDGTHAIGNLANRKRIAFERYQAALGALNADILTPRPPQRLAQEAPATSKASSPALRPQITAREVQVLDRIADGMTSKEIAAALNISFKTAVTHRTNLMSKFDATNVALLIRRAIASGHIKP